MAGDILSVVVQNIWDQLSQESDRFRGVKGQVTELQTDLQTLKSFLKDADAKKYKSEVVKSCIAEIKEIIFDAEDIIETFILKDELGKNGGIKKRIRRFACIFPERREIALEIGSISERIKKVVRKMKDFGVQQQMISDARDPQPSQQIQQYAREYESNLVGLEKNVEKLVGYLVEGDDFQVVSMTGMGGLGKTTLARQAFHHDKVKSKFDRLVWVCVSQVCDPMDVWRTIFRTLKPNEEEKISGMAKDTLQDQLFQLLETFKSLIIFDDIWKEEHWELIKKIFPHTKGSKVLLTSRNESVAGRRETYNFKPEYLSDEDSWTLFERIAMPSKNTSELKNVDKKMEEMGKQMIKHCWGLPLAIRVLGGLLRANYTLHYWNRVSENIGSHLLRGRTNLNKDDNYSLNHILSLSFEELPGYLKYCFLYFAHFPEDYEIGVEGLFYYWAAEGILRYHDGETIGDVGDIYIDELVRRNMVISERDNNTSRFETCRLHDLMRDLCLSKAEEENFLQIVSPGAHPQSLSVSRRFVSHYPHTLDVGREINNLKVRSLVVFWNRFWKPSNLSFTRLQQLRVLQLPGAKLKGRKLLPYSIGKLIHLRYLSLEDVKVSHLPSSLGNLKLLIYLNLNVNGYSIFMPDVLMGMRELRFLALPRFLRKKTKLEMSNLVNLETLENFSTENCNLEDLRGMARLRILRIWLTSESSLETLSASIGRLRHLENLDVQYKGAKETKEWRTLLDFSNLKQLELTIWIPLLSNKVQFPSRITQLNLYFCKLEEDPMPILEKLTQLKKFLLGFNSFCGRRMVCSAGGFPQLEKLNLLKLDKWEEWIIEEGSMPLLHTLKIVDCKKLKELPDGLQFITSLKYLTLYDDMGDKWKERLSEGGEDYHKIQHIPFVTL